jgi:HlyD family secretion protein
MRKSLLLRSNVGKYKLLPLCLGFSLAVALSGCGGEEKEATPVVSVKVQPAQRSAISQVVTGEALVFPLQQATIAPKITSTIREFNVQRGSRVRKGQLLAVLENKDLAAAELQSRGELEQAQAAFVSTTQASLPQQLQKAELDAAAAKSALDAQQKVYDSRKDLFQQGALPRRDLDAAAVALVQAKSQYKTAQRQFDDLQRVQDEQLRKSATGQLAAARGKYEGAQAQLSYSEIRSPINGVVTDRPLYPGDLASANQPLLTVMDTSRLIAKAHLAEADCAALKIGDPAELRIPRLDEPVKARVTLVSPALDPGSTTIEVWFEAVKPNSMLHPGMTVQVSVTARTVKDAIVVPDSALFKDPEGAEYVLLAGSDGRAHVKKVQVGISHAGLTQVVDGLNAGDPVITDGGYGVPNGTQIRIEPGAASSGSADPAGKPPAKPSGKSAKDADED